MSESKSLFAGPFVGEFGHELFCWQGILRAAAKNFKHITIVCKTGHDYLYQDFADTIINYNPQSNIPIGSYNKGLTKNYPKPPKNFKGKYFGPNIRLADEFKDGTMRFYKKKFNEQLFIKYGRNEACTRYNYIIHARHMFRDNVIKKLCTHLHQRQSIINTKKRNWPKENWVELVSQLKGRIACIGTQKDALHIEGTDDLRGKDLSFLCNVLASSDIIIGPSSGPLHLASLCGTSQLFWHGDPKNTQKYNKTWNPFGTKAFEIKSENWNPSTQEVLDKILHIYEN
tara:strand:- start:1101 stop:1955 length:855 start_codon:yes stop_codon:yes gene_type:complete